MDDILLKQFTVPFTHCPVDDSIVLWIKGSLSRRESEIVADISKKSNTGVVYGASWANTPLGHSTLSFNGVNNYVNVGNPESLQIAKNLTVEVWVYFNRYKHQVVNYTIAKHPGWGFFVGGDVGYLNDIGVFYNNELSVYADGVFNSVGIKTWCHLVFNYNGSTTEIYLNGVSQPITGTCTNNLITTNALNIGRRTDGFGHIDGFIDEVRIYNRVLSPVEVNKRYQETKHFFGY